MAKHSKEDTTRAIENLRACYPEGSTVYTILRDVSRSGMSRTVGVVSLQGDGGAIAARHPNWAVSVLLGYRLKSQRWDGVVVGGCGFDAGHDIAYNLGRALYGNGYALKHQWL